MDSTMAFAAFCAVLAVFFAYKFLFWRRIAREKEVRLVSLREKATTWRTESIEFKEKFKTSEKSLKELHEKYEAVCGEKNGDDEDLPDDVIDAEFQRYLKDSDDLSMGRADIKN